MITRNYKDYTIAVTRIVDGFGHGFRAFFYVAKDNGIKENVRTYDTYQRTTFKDTVADVKKIIDALG